MRLFPYSGWVRTVSVMLIGLLGVTLIALGSTIIVKDDGTTPDLQTALDSAVAGDTVLVLPGTYHGRFVMPVEMQLVGSGAGVSILDGEGLGTTLWLKASGGGLHAVRGFTITGGSGSGLRVTTSGAVVEDNIIEGNSGSVGGGARVEACLATLRNNVVRNNSATVGGGIYAESRCEDIWNLGFSVRITNNIIYGNTAVQGGGVASYRYGSVGITDLPAITHNTIVGNSANEGGGVFIETDFGDFGPPDVPTGRITNNVISGNSGGGVRVICDYAGSCGSTYSIGYPEVEGNLVFDNGPFEISGGLVGVGSAGNISMDPQFQDAGAGDYRLSGLSPALDAGTVLSVFPVEEDGVSFPRPLDGNLNGVAAPDMGAFENRGEASDLAVAGDLLSLSWKPRSGVVAYHLYRGDLSSLRSGGNYTQDPLSVPEARQWCDLNFTAFDDPDLPAPGTLFFYLVTPVDLQEGSLGYDGDKQPRQNAHPCP